MCYCLIIREMKKFILIKNVNGRGVGNLRVIDGNENVNVLKNI